jgi:hypothetical protein
VVKAIEHLVNMAADCDGTRGLVDKLLALEAQEDAIRTRMSEAPHIAPDIHPNIAKFYRKVSAHFVARRFRMRCGHHS